jgi:hypothetical protein
MTKDFEVTEPGPCYFCGSPCAADDFCYGCGAYVCDDCETVKSAPHGIHKPAAHRGHIQCDT